MEDSGIDSDPKIPASFGNNVVYEYGGSDTSCGSFNGHDVPVSRQLTRKLEQKLQDGKKLPRTQLQQSQQLGDYRKLNTCPNLIPIQRLSIPSKEQLPLVEWDSDESEEVHFFPINKPNLKAELTDTFSIQEMEVSADEDDLNLLTPKETFQKFQCCPFSFKCCIL